ncbi:MAG: hypothetical protein J7K68_04005 [Candidatus Diapherotrites archaeon]|nr:hypothetical protein [Candidatus Diapherotrites archaeon]
MAKKCECVICNMPNPMFWGIVLTIVGIVYILQEMGTQILPKGVSLWSVLVLILGLFTLYHKIQQ